MKQPYVMQKPLSFILGPELGLILHHGDYGVSMSQSDIPPLFGLSPGWMHKIRYDHPAGLPWWMVNFVECLMNYKGWYRALARLRQQPRYHSPELGHLMSMHWLEYDYHSPFALRYAAEWNAKRLLAPPTDKDKDAPWPTFTLPGMGFKRLRRDPLFGNLLPLQRHHPDPILGKLPKYQKKILHPV